MKTARNIMLFRNEKGVALVLVLVLSLIGLAMVSALLFMVTQGTTLSGAIRTYRTAEEAGVGIALAGGEMLANQGQSAVLFTPTIPATMPGCDCVDPTNYTDNVIRGTATKDILCDKLCNPTNQYDTNGLLAEPDQNPDAEVSLSVDPTSFPDGTQILGTAPDAYQVFWKITDTIEGNSDTGGIVSSGELAGGGVVSSSAGLVNPPHTPYIYRLEVQAQRTTGARERARFSMLYGY